MSSRKSLFFVLPFLLFWIANANAATINAASCSQSDVQAAINSSVTGDTVSVPAGSCTWTSTVTIPSTKKILLQGTGMASTIITRQKTVDPPNWEVINLAQSGSRLTGFQFVNGTVLVDGDGWRIDNCKFYRAADSNEGVLVWGNRSNTHPTGLIDHCYFYNTRVYVYGWNGLLAHAFWAQPLNLGSSYAVYVEDNTFVRTFFGNVIDAHCGGRFVFRYNTVTDGYIEAHSVQGNHRATRSWEIYNNTINQVSRSMWVPMMLRGGTGVVFNNTVSGKWDLPKISLDNVRSCPDTRDFGTDPGWCTGSSRWDGNAANGYPCRDQIGRSTDQWLWTSTSPYPPQQLDPAYAWNNKIGTSDVTFNQHGCALSVSHIQPGRDYFDNTVKPGYAPYTYPHPLTQSWGISENTTPTATATMPPTTTTTTTTPTITTVTTKNLTKVYNNGKLTRVIKLFNR